MKRKLVIGIIILAVIAVGGVTAFKIGLFGGSDASSDESEIYVASLSECMGIGSSYTPEVYMGVVEGEETTSINKSSEYEIDELFVAEGDTVSTGDSLFSYKTDSISAEITQYEFDIEGYELQIADYNRQIDSIVKLRDKTKVTTEIEDYNNQIAALNTSIAMAQNNIDQTNAKITDDKDKLTKSTVTSPVDGVITKIADTTNEYSTDAYITILGSGEKRVKGKINEQNVWSINVDTKVTLRSRVDSSQTWTGTITSIDTENKNSDDSGTTYYSDSSNSDSSSTSYPFYITLDSADGLMMGQHLYIELSDEAAEPEIDFSTGTYIYDYYLAYDDNGDAYVWTTDSKNKLKKVYVTLGDYNEDMMVYEVIDGITYDDMIAYPMDDYEEGMSCVSSYEVE